MAVFATKTLKKLGHNFFVIKQICWKGFSGKKSAVIQVRSTFQSGVIYIGLQGVPTANQLDNVCSLVINPRQKKVCLSITNAFFRRSKGHLQCLNKSMADCFINLLVYSNNINHFLTTKKCFHLNYGLLKNLILSEISERISEKGKNWLSLSCLRK